MLWGASFEINDITFYLSMLWEVRLFQLVRQYNIWRLYKVTSFKTL